MKNIPAGEVSYSEADIALQACPDQIRSCVYVSLVADHPDEALAHIEKFRKFFADHPEKIMPHLFPDEWDGTSGQQP